MRWWQALRQAYPKRSALTLAIAALIVCAVVGGAITGAAAVTLHLTATEQFCTSCHELRDNAYAEFKGTIHDKNRSGVHVECADCHLPRELVPMLIRKVQASREVWGHIMGKLDTKEKYDKARYEMAVREWTRMKKNHSQECRNCHDFDSMDPEKQSETARERHKGAKSAGTDCIDCHFGIAHTEPDGPGPKELKIAR